MQSSGPSVIGIDEQGDLPVDLDRWVALAAAALVDQGISSVAAELNLTFVDEAIMAELNEQHMGHEGPTDVLSFPLEMPPGEVHSPTDATEPVLLGDIVLCPAVAHHNAPTHAGTYEDELALLVVHGVLHILGHDHAEPADEAAMQELERRLLTSHYQPRHTQTRP
jgi:probable rRNA maturation factor